MEQEKDALRDYNSIAITLKHQSNRMGDGLFQFAQRIVTQLEQCASVEKEQSIRIVLLQRHVAFK